MNRSIFGTAAKLARSVAITMLDQQGTLGCARDNRLNDCTIQDLFPGNVIAVRIIELRSAVSLATNSMIAVSIATLILSPGLALSLVLITDVNSKDTPSPAQPLGKPEFHLDVRTPHLHAVRIEAKPTLQ
jgi:hypothetical protein